MKFSNNWLREWVNPDLDTDALAHQITMAGLEVDGIEPAAPAFSGVVVGRITEIAPHPDADKLRICQVECGEESLVQVVCGAANAAQDMRVPFATVGAVLPGDFKIKKAKLRGVESYGMLCSAKELGLAESSPGLMPLPQDAPVGADVRAYLGLDDDIIEVDLTPNRSDCLSLLGLAREVGVLNRLEISEPDFAEVEPTIEDTFPVNVSAGADCPRYLGRIIRGVNMKARTPMWMVERLRRGGIRSIDPAVDVTNYVMLELGQPMHGFDLASLKGGIEVRRARAGEHMTLLDGKDATLEDDMLVIADAEGPVALAGIMGGAHSGVSEATQDIFLESAFFNPVTIAGRARRLGLHTDSSHRFERGVDFDLQLRALGRATALLLEIVGGEAGPVIEAVSEEDLPSRPAINLRRERIGRLLGFSLADEDVEDILRREGCQLDSTDNGWMVTPPSFRFDLAIEEDLIEELARVYGYDRLEGESIAMRPTIQPRSEATIERQRIAELLVDRGYREAITYSFVDRKLMEKLEPAHKPLELANPISSEMSAMRTNLWAGLVKTAQFNLNRQQHRIRLFETGLRFVPENGDMRQEAMLAGLVTGSAEPEQWASASRPVDYYDLKGDVEAILALAGLDQRVRYSRSEHPALHPGRSADIHLDGRLVGRLGALHPNLENALDLDQNVYLFELELAAISRGRVPAYAPVSRFPAIRRDLALLAREAVSAQAVREVIEASGGELLREVRIFDIYRGKGVEEGCKSIALGLILQDFSRTLSDDEVDALVSTILDKLHSELDITLRD